MAFATEVINAIFVKFTSCYIQSDFYLLIEAVQNANLAEYMRIKSRVEEAGDRLEGALQDANLAAIKSSNQLVLDPSDPEDKKQIDSMAEMTGIKPYESIGMPDFK